MTVQLQYAAVPVLDLNNSPTSIGTLCVAPWCPKHTGVSVVASAFAKSVTFRGTLLGLFCSFGLFGVPMRSVQWVPALGHDRAMRYRRAELHGSFLGPTLGGGCLEHGTLGSTLDRHVRVAHGRAGLHGHLSRTGFAHGRTGLEAGQFVPNSEIFYK